MRVIETVKGKQQSVVTGKQHTSKLIPNIMVNSDNEESDKESDSANDDTDDTDQDIFSLETKSDACSELTDKMCNLSVYEKKKCKEIINIDNSLSEKNSDSTKSDEETLIARSPVPAHSTNNSRQNAQPYSLDSARRNNLQNGGQIIAENPTCLGLSYQVNSLQGTLIPQSVRNFKLNTETIITVTPPDSESQKVLVPGIGLVPLNDLEEFVVDELKKQSDDSDVLAETFDYDSLFLPDDFIKNTSYIESGKVVSNLEYENVNFSNVEIREKSSTPNSEDSTYGSLATSPFNPWSPYSNVSSSESSLTSDVGFVNNICSPSYQIFDLQSQIDNDETSAVFNSVHLNIPHTDNRPLYLNIDSRNQSAPGIQNKTNQEFFENTNSSTNEAILSINNKQPSKMVPAQTCYLSQKTNDKHIQPFGVIVYDNPTSATQRLYEIVKHSKLYNLYTAQYIRVCLEFKDNPEKLKKTMFNLFREKRSSVDDCWLSVMYAYIEYIVSINTEEFVRIFTSKDEGQSLLYLACMNHSDLPIVARYIAEVMVKLNRNVNESYNDADQNSLIHLLAYKGDSHVKLLAELLQVKKFEKSVFNINYRNNKLQTPLHFAVMGHSEKKSCFTTIKYLIDHDAKISKDIRNMTPLHMAVLGTCEPNIVRKLLPVNCSDIIDLQDVQGNTALHLAYKNDTFPDKQEEVISILLANKANTKISNLKGELPCSGKNFKKISHKKQIYC